MIRRSVSKLFSRVVLFVNSITHTVGDRLERSSGASDSHKIDKVSSLANPVKSHNIVVAILVWKSLHNYLVAGKKIAAAFVQVSSSIDCHSIQLTASAVGHLRICLRVQHKSHSRENYPVVSYARRPCSLILLSPCRARLHPKQKTQQAHSAKTNTSPVELQVQS